MNVIVNLAVARDNYPFNPGPNAKTKFPADYQVDYVRVWKLEGLPSKNTFQIDVNQKANNHYRCSLGSSENQKENFTDLP